MSSNLISRKAVEAASSQMKASLEGSKQAVEISTATQHLGVLDVVLEKTGIETMWFVQGDTMPTDQELQDVL